jgi:hypothetical protein
MKRGLPQRQIWKKASSHCKPSLFNLAPVGAASIFVNLRQPQQH